MARGILVFIEIRNGQVRKASLEALCEARRLAAPNAEPVTALLIGEGVKGLVSNVARHAPDKTLIFDSSQAGSYSTEGYAAILACAVKQEDPRFVLGAMTAMGKDLIPRVAARFDSPCASDVVDISDEGGKLLVVRPMYSGKILGYFEFGAPLVFVMLRPNAFPLDEPRTGARCTVEDLSVTLPEVRARVSEVHAAAGGKVELSEARIIVSGGRGIKGPEHWGMLQELCDVLGAALGASRAVVDAGWIDHQHQVGQTGKTVSPQLYIACGVSGAIQHLAGMSSSKIIVAINKDPNAPIFKHATYGVVGDVFEIIPKFTEECRKLLAQS